MFLFFYKGGSYIDKIHSKIVQIHIDKIEVSPFQERKNFSTKEIEALSQSIKENGLLQPISVRKKGNGKYQLIAGERRYRAFKLLNEKTIPSVIANIDDEKSAVLGYFENVQRENLNCFEQAKAIDTLLKIWNCTQEQGAKKLCMAQSTLANKLRLLTLTQEQQKICIENSLTERHARAVLVLQNEREKEEVLKIIVKNKLNVSQTEELIKKRILKEFKEKKSKPKLMIKDVRIFLNTIDKAVLTMKNSGVNAISTRKDTEQYIEYTVRIPT